MRTKMLTPLSFSISLAAAGGYVASQATLAHDGPMGGNMMMMDTNRDGMPSKDEIRATHGMHRMYMNHDIMLRMDAFMTA